MLMKLDKLECNEKKNELLLSNVYFRLKVELLGLVIYMHLVEGEWYSFCSFFMWGFVS